ncbi:hypothetical protein Chor_013642 [Crotalus horridus]
MLSLFTPDLGGGHSFLIQNVRLQKCIHASPHKAEQVGLSDCKARSPQHQWSWDGAALALVNQHTRECLAVSNAEELAVAQLDPCGEGSLQRWSCSKKGHLTLQGHGLHLSTKLGGHHTFLSREKDRFSKWRTDTGSIVYKTVGSLEIYTPPVKATTFLMIHLESQSYVTSRLPVSNNRHLEADDRDLRPAEAFVGLQRGKCGAVGWHMLFLSSIVQLVDRSGHFEMSKWVPNPADPWKKKLLALKSRQMSCEEHQPSPGTVSPTSKMRIIPASPSPSLKHGEILIEWKDGTTTSLFDHSY